MTNFSIKENNLLLLVGRTTKLIAIVVRASTFLQFLLWMWKSGISREGIFRCECAAFTRFRRLERMTLQIECLIALNGVLFAWLETNVSVHIVLFRSLARMKIKIRLNPNLHKLLHLTDREDYHALSTIAGRIDKTH